MKLQPEEVVVPAQLVFNETSQHVAKARVKLFTRLPAVWHL